MQHGKSERKNELHMYGCMLFGSVCVPLGLDIFLVVRLSVCLSVAALSRQRAH